MNIIRHRKIFYILSTILFIVSIASIAVFGLRYGIDFTGGSILEGEYGAASARPTVEEIRARIAPLELGDVRIQPIGEKSILVRLGHIDEAGHQNLAKTLAGEDAGFVEKRFDTIGPSIGRELRDRALFAIVLVILLIVSYVAFAFRKVSAPVASWKYGIVTIVALLHDVVIPAGAFAAAGHWLGYEADTLFVTALLTILGFSVHDTIVVFDRIREHLRKTPNPADFEALVSQSVKETFARSVNTSLTVALALLAVFIAGGDSTRPMVFTLLVGVLIGTYSSIFIGSPLLVTWFEFQRRR